MVELDAIGWSESQNNGLQNRLKKSWRINTLAVEVTISQPLTQKALSLLNWGIQLCGSRKGCFILIPFLLYSSGLLELKGNRLLDMNFSLSQSRRNQRMWTCFLPCVWESCSVLSLCSVCSPVIYLFFMSAQLPLGATWDFYPQGLHRVSLRKKGDIPRTRSLTPVCSTDT